MRFDWEWRLSRRSVGVQSSQRCVDMGERERICQSEGRLRDIADSQWGKSPGGTRSCRLDRYQAEIFGSSAAMGTTSVGTLGDLNDLWEFQISSGDWIWMGGSDVDLAGGVRVRIRPARRLRDASVSFYGEHSRRSDKCVSSWSDSNGNFWLFGGEGYDANDSDGDLNDVWEFQPSTGKWAWMGGNAAVPPGQEEWPGSYGLFQQPGNGSLRGGREPESVVLAPGVRSGYLAAFLTG